VKLYLEPLMDGVKKRRCYDVLCLNLYIWFL